MVLTYDLLIEGVVSGKLVQKFGPRKVTMFGVAFYVSGMMVSAFVPVSQPWILYLSYGTFPGMADSVLFNR